MTRILRPQRAGAAGLILATLLLAAAASAAPARKWVDTWGQSMTSNFSAVKGKDGKLRMDSWAHPVERAPQGRDLTLRQTVLTSVGGDRVRIHLSNYFGRAPLRISVARIAEGRRGDDASAEVAGSSRELSFHGHHSVVVAPGHSVTSDPLAMHVAPLSRLVVSLYFAGPVQFGDMHPMEHERSTALVHGDRTGAASLAHAALPTGLKADMRTHIYFLDGVAVSVPARTRGIVAFGDSITDGAYATAPSRPWPEAMAAIANGPRGHTPAAVVNAGISADELTTDQIGYPSAGVSGLKRFERDVIDRPGVTDVMVLFGANDINRGIDPAGLPDGASSGDLIAGLRMLADVAHRHHVRFYVGTVTPFAGFTVPGWYSPRKEAVRQRVNAWIRHSKVIDGVIEFDRAVQGPYKPSPMAARHHPLPPGMATICAGDAGLHPNDRGYEVMGTLAYDRLFGAHLTPSRPCHG